MCKILTVLMLGCVAAVAQPPKLDGKWLPEAARLGSNNSISMIWHSVLELDGDKFALTKPIDMEVPFSGTFKFDAKNPTHVDIHLAAHDLKGCPWPMKLPATTLPGLCTLDGETLTVTFARDATKPRPKSIVPNINECMLKCQRAPKDFTTYPKDVVVRVVDNAGVAGKARVGTFLSDATARNPPSNIVQKPEWTLGDQAKNLDAKGEVKFAYGDNIFRQSCLIAFEVERNLIAVSELSPARLALKPEVVMQLQPACKVSIQAECAELKASTESDYYNSYVMTPAGARISYVANKSGELNYLLPPGDYECWVYGQMMSGARKSFTVPKDQSSYTAKPISVPPSNFLKLIKNKAPELTGVLGWKGKPVTLADCKGKFVMLEFWGHWCGPCIASMPVLFDLHEKFPNDLVVIGVHVDAEDDINTSKKLDEKIKVSVDKAWKGKDLPFSTALVSGKTTTDDETRSRGTAAEQYGVRGFPTTVLIDRAGNVVSVFHAHDTKYAIEEFEKLLKK